MIKPKQCGCYGLEHRSGCVEYVKPKPEPVDKYTVERFVKTGIGMAVWNAALDAAAKRCDEVRECVAAARIRELKK